MIQTVNGKINNLPSGKALLHEHISCMSSHFFNAFGKRWLDKEYLVEYVADVLKIAKEKYSVNECYAFNYYIIHYYDEKNIL